ncbi:hypothetical protein OQA88_12442 [Cercophora sp. LCS_1]
MTRCSHGYGQPAIPTIPSHAVKRLERYKKIWLLLDLFCFAWIVPIVFALYFNLHSFVVGAGVGCKVPNPSELCFPDLFGVKTTNRHERLMQLNKEDRVVLNILQFVAKALEDWFVIIASSIVFSMAMRLATAEKGLPLSYLFTHISVADLTMLFDRAFWTSCKASRRGKARIRLLCFVSVVVLLCILCNLMGPAIAVLLIPQLAWTKFPAPAAQLERFESISLSQAPKVCEAQARDVPARNYSCTNIFWPSFDELSSGYRWRTDWFFNGWSPLPVFTEHLGLLFTLNTTSPKSSDVSSDWISWVPLRQSLFELAADYVEVQASQGFFDTPEDEFEALDRMDRARDERLFDRYRNTLDIVLHRKAPSVGFSTRCIRTANVVEYRVSDARSVRCHLAAGPEGLHWFACFGTGSGWGDEVVHSHFSIGDTDGTSEISVDIYAATKSTATTDNSSAAACGRLATGDVSQPCDWETVFALDDGIHEDLEVSSKPVQFVEYSKPQPSGGNLTVLCADAAYVEFPDYSISVSPDQNFAGIVRLEVPADFNSSEVSLHPDWILAAWSVDQPSGSVEGTRPAAVNLVYALKNVGPPPLLINDSDYGLTLFATMHAVSVEHGMTLINYTTTNALTNTTDDPLKPVFTVSKSLRVWAYDCQTRTFKFAAAVAILGCVVAFLRPLASVLFRTRRPSTLRFLAAALQRPPLESLYGLQKERDIGRASLRVVPHEENDEMVALQEIIGPTSAIEMR